MNLQDLLTQHFRLDENHKKALRKLGLKDIQDLLFYFPIRYSHVSEIKPINELTEGEQATIYGKFQKLDIKKSYLNKKIRAEGEVLDETGKIKVIWFNQAYIAKMVHEGQFVELTGRVTKSKNGIYLANPEFKKMSTMPIDVHNSLFSTENKNKIFGFPIYAETRGISSKWFYHAILKILKEKNIQNIEDYLPEEILKKYHLPSLKSALVWIHAPQNDNDAESARKRFAFEEVFFIQLKLQKDRKEYRQNQSFKIEIEKKDVERFTERFPFSFTDAQNKSIDTILKDIQRNVPMSRLLEGDVGSGKTAVASTVSYAIITQKKADLPANLQVAYMAPTEILATQHFESFIKYFNHLPINIGLITGSGCRKFPSKVNPSGWTDISKKQLLKWTEEGSISIVIGTHALIQKTVKFKNLALAIIDEQHRFGTEQRKKLIQRDSKGKWIAPHLLSMTATPIPRTLALTIYGDLDLSILDQMPSDRKQIITEIITPEKREEVYEKIRTEMQKGRQLYVICPRIFEPDPQKELALQAKSAVAEAKRLKKEIFPEYEIDVLHSKMSKQKKEEAMQKFSNGDTHILCATSVVEVGVNVPNATIIIIEGAERFGLAQLHQLRGRVIRSSHQAYCYVFAEAKSQKTLDRLRALKTAKNGFELAELDLTLRGSGELLGGKQWGINDLGMEAIRNIKMVEAARTEAKNLIEKDTELNEYPILQAKSKNKTERLHFE
ncbi:MAG: ATP-dependent DNA helicase RecG [Candidatus Pacebacteria bacterium]|nr:ATP-dependent DNA helicase RecG [Candidatus Paceibacterota bacterium]MCF7862579.1 ATP-dependent DNA helicase RecG [Candidatus Paceibacterota bacterium]